jgi:hypothetical protein
MKGRTILFTEMTPDIDWEDRFNKWNDGHFVPSRLAAPGLAGAQRYKHIERETYLAIYEAENESAMGSEEFLSAEDYPNSETKWMLSNILDYSSYTGNQITDLSRDKVSADPLDAPILYSQFFSVPDDREEDFNTWYENEHIPMLLKCDDWLMCRRFLIEDGEPQPWTHLALHYLNDMSAFDSPEREAAESTDLFKKLSEEQWFQGSTTVYLKHGDRFVSPG